MRPVQRIPRVFNFPLGYKVKVIKQDRDDFVEEHGSDAVALWYEGTNGGAINLDRSRQEHWVEDLVHELDHMWIDYKEHLVDYFTGRLKR